MFNIPSEFTVNDIPKLFPDARTIIRCSLARSPYSDSTKVATLSVDEIPATLRMTANERQRKITFTADGLCSFEATVDDHFWGLTPLNDTTADTSME
jgi:hypothetical protein